MQQTAGVKRARLLPVALLAVALAASACGGSSNPSTNGARAGASPSVTGPAATSPATSAPATAARLIWKACDGDFECSTLRVQLDDKNPAKGTLDLALARSRATSSKRIGSLLVNPGGPGASAIGFLEGAYKSLPEDVRARFDIVAFDPRGVGRSAAVRCATTAEFDRYLALDPDPDNQAELDAYVQANRDLDAGCAKRSGRILPYVGTDTVADDMDRVRAALGDAKLSYLGYSYGTAIGAAYLDRYPTHVRAMVLDGAIDPTLSWEQLAAGQGVGFDRAMLAFLDNCQSTSCSFRKQVSGDIGAAFDRLAAKVDVSPLPAAGARRVGPGEFFLGVAGSLYSTASWPVLADSLALAERGDGSGLLVLSDSFTERGPKGYDPLLESINAVNCIDRAWPRDVASYVAAGERIRSKAPRFGRAIVLAGMSCIAWPVAPVSTPHAVAGKGAPPVVVIGTTRDPATPYEWAQGLAKQLSSGILISHNGDGHTVYRTSAPACITQPVNAYLIDLIAPKPLTC